MSENIERAVQEYDASQIQVLEGLEAVRKRPGMYIGSTSSSGLHHLVYEIVDNSIDEAMAGYCSHIELVIEPGDIISVSDNGRGIPVDIQEQTGKSALEVVFTVLHAGGKFGGGGYKVSGGLHGVGASVVNALSEWLEVRVHKDGKIYEMKFSRGEITQGIKVVGETDRNGTSVGRDADGDDALSAGPRVFPADGFPEGPGGASGRQKKGAGYGMRNHTGSTPASCSPLMNSKMPMNQMNHSASTMLCVKVAGLTE